MEKFNRSPQPSGVGEVTKEKIDYSINPKIAIVAEELGTWMQSESPEFNRFTFSLLASLPLDDETIEDIEGTTGVKRHDFIGWKESELIEKMLNAIDDQSAGKIFWNKLKEVI
jgi:hypothetical protein